MEYKCKGKYGESFYIRTSSNNGSVGGASHLVEGNSTVGYYLTSDKLYPNALYWYFNNWDGVTNAM